MPDRPAVTPESRAGGGTQEAEAQVSAGYTTLLRLLETREPVEPEVIDARAALAVAVARAGRLDEALYQVDEVVKDAGRAHGPDHAATAAAREAQATVREIAGIGEG